MPPIEEVSWSSDALQVTLLPEIGFRVHRLRAFGVDLLRTPGDKGVHASEPYFWGAYVMAPWCNRITPGPQTVEGRTVDLPSTFPDGTAIHGQVSSTPWTADADGTFRITAGGDGWPWRYEVLGRVAVEDATLALDYRLVNRSDGTMPAGIGFHPWFRKPVELRVDAATVYASNSGSAATARPVHSDLDLRSLESPPPNLDGTWVATLPQAVTLAWPYAGIRATLDVEAGRAFVAVATPETIDAIAVEPQTHAPDGLRRLLNAEPDAMSELAPGQSLRLALRITVERVSLSA